MEGTTCFIINAEVAGWERENNFIVFNSINAYLSYIVDITEYVINVFNFTSLRSSKRFFQQWAESRRGVKLGGKEQ